MEAKATGQSMGCHGGSTCVKVSLHGPAVPHRGGLAGRQKHEKQVGPMKEVSKEGQATNDTMCIGPNKIERNLRWTWGSGPAALSVDPFSISLGLGVGGNAMMGAKTLNKPRRGDV